jgi:protein SCO1/2
VLGVLAAVANAAIVSSCNSRTREAGAYPAANDNDCLPDIRLIDQYDRKISLSSLKGKPVLFDFIYTSCPGPCLALTARMKSIANQLGPLLRTRAWFVSVTVDPEHDSPNQLRDYAKEQGAAVDGWLFLTGPPRQIDQLMARFKLQRQREPDGSVDHVLEFFLVGTNGRPLVQYAASEANPAKTAGDVDQVIEGKRLVACNT